MENFYIKSKRKIILTIVAVFIAAIAFLINHTALFSDQVKTVICYTILSIAIIIEGVCQLLELKQLKMANEPYKKELTFLIFMIILLIVLWLPI